VRNRKAGWSGLFCLGALGIAFLASAATAAPVTLKVEGASVAEDEHTHQIVLDIAVRPAERELLRHFSEAHIGKKIDLRIAGKTSLTTVIREPLLGGSIRISGNSAEDMRAVLSQLSSGHAVIELDAAPN
jgi:preprotein translocase subunit SecD